MQSQELRNHKGMQYNKDVGLLVPSQPELPRHPNAV